MSPNRWSGKTQLHAGTLLGVLSLCAFLGLGVWFWQANAAQELAGQAQTARLAVVELSGKNLAGKLDEQRAQFEACKDAKPGTPGCASPITPPAKEVAPQIFTGQMGLQGYQGIPGADSTVPGPAGAAGVAGKDSTIPGPQGVSGVNGADSLVPGPAGVDGTNGTNGTDGQSAYPFTFSFTTTAGLTYTCTLTAANTPGTCTEVPTATPTTGG